MKLREDYPIYINPDFDEISAISKYGWNTLRILESDKYIIIGSGYGNTHESLHRAAKQLLSKREVSNLIDFILYYEGQICYFNMLGHTNKNDERLRAQDAMKYFSTNAISILKDIIRESGYSL